MWDRQCGLKLSRSDIIVFFGTLIILQAQISASTECESRPAYNERHAAHGRCRSEQLADALTFICKAKAIDASTEERDARRKGVVGDCASLRRRWLCSRNEECERVDHLVRRCRLPGAKLVGR